MLKNRMPRSSQRERGEKQKRMGYIKEKIYEGAINGFCVNKWSERCL